MAERDEIGNAPRRSPSEDADPLSLPKGIARLPGVPKTPQGWWTFGLTIMAILIAAVLWLRYH